MRWKFLLCTAILPAAALSPAIARAAAAEPLCVTCSGPDQVYLCSVSSAQAGLDPNPLVLQLLCAQELARSGGHQSCAVRRGAATCEGLPRHLVYSAPDMGIPAPQAFPVEESTGVAAAPVEEPVGQGEPKTVVELAGRAADTAGKQLKKAGESLTGLTTSTGEAVGGAAQAAGSTIGSAAKKTWGCLSSLFLDCGATSDEPPDERP